MTRDEARQLLPIIKAYAEGKTIEFCNRHGKWEGDANSILGFGGCPEDYRIKTEPKYRPFKNAEECWNEMQKHQPFGWVHRYNEEPMDEAEDCGNYKEKGYYGYHHIEWVYKAYIFIEGDEYFFFPEESQEKSMRDCMDYYEFADGEPFGIKVEED